MRRGFVLVTLVLATSVGVAVLTALPALGKGPSQAVLEGPGISSPIALRDPGDPTIGPELAALVQGSGFFTLLGCRVCDDRLRHRPSGELGPRYTVTYTMTVTTDKGTRSDEVVQYLFPYAVPHPVTHVPAGQRFWFERTVGGWFVAGSGLVRLLHELGVPPQEIREQPAEVAAAEEDARSPLRTVLPASALVVILTALAVAVVWGRMRRRPTDVRA